MSSILYGGLKYTQVRHAIFCKKCNSTIESKYHYDFKMCPCGSIGVYGGIHGRILGDLENMEHRAMFVARVRGKTLWLPQKIIEEYFRVREASQTSVI